jgi:hypothetical protein
MDVFQVFTTFLCLHSIIEKRETGNWEGRSIARAERERVDESLAEVSKLSGSSQSSAESLGLAIICSVSQILETCDE